MHIDRNYIRRPAVAGQFYPASREALERKLDIFFENAKLAKINGEIIGLIAPHAGYDFSGLTAATAFKQVRGKNYDAVVIIGFDHRPYTSGVFVQDKGGYETPLGVVPVNEEIAASIVNHGKGLISSYSGNDSEHSIEVEVPFLQKVIDDLSIVPIKMMADHSYGTCEKLAKAIVDGTRGRKVLLVASSDLYHGYSYDECVESDRRTLEHIEDFDPKRLHDCFDNGDCMACGVGPIVTLLLAARAMGADKAEVVASINSNDVMGERGGYVVGYGGVVVYKSSGSGGSGEEKVGVELGLSREDKELLMKIAREAISCSVRGKPLPKYDPSSPILREKRGAFVTINKHGNLRGCIGYIEAYKPLYETVQEMAVAAALRDPRFPPVTEDELDDLEVEISVLTPIRKIRDINEIEVGKHGIIIRKGYNQGLLLPQVATEYGWDRITFLEHTCLKAGLPRDAWKDPDTEIMIFSAEVFGEE